MRSDKRTSKTCPAVAAIALAAVLATGAGRAALAEPAGDPATRPAAASETSGATAGKPSMTEIPTRDLWTIITSGGPLMIPIGLCSFLLLVFVLERMISLRRGRVIPAPFVSRFLEQMRKGQLDRESALARCDESSSPVAAVFAGAVRKWGRPAVEVEQGIIDAGERATNGLRRYLRVLNGVATVSPLLGLLGTVVGMIQAFNAVATADALGRPELLASGISQALLTTAAGLTVAIPALIFYLFFVSRVDRLIVEIDALGQQLVHLISAEELQQTQPAGNGQKRKKVAAATT